MEGQINTSFATVQRDLFESGLVAQIGVNSFAVWMGIKAHADYNTGIAWPSIRHLMKLTGLASATVQKALRSLEENKLLRSQMKGRRRIYLARERLDVRLGTRVICTVVVDYVPAKFRATLARVKAALATGEDDPDAFAQVEILPGPGFSWDDKNKVLRGSIRPSELPETEDEPLDQLASGIVAKARQIALTPKKRPAVSKRGG